MKIMPPSPKTAPTKQQKLAGILIAAGVGCIIGIVGWALTNNLAWFYAIPLAALFGFNHSRDFRPPVIW